MVVYSIMYNANYFTQLINDIWSLHLGIISIVVSIMTLLMSSLYDKVEEYNNIKSSDDIHLMMRKTTLLNSIKVFRNVNRKLKNVLLSTFSLFLISTALKYLELTLLVDAIIVLVVILSVCLVFWGAKVAFDAFKQYQKDN